MTELERLVDRAAIEMIELYDEASVSRKSLINLIMTRIISDAYALGREQHDHATHKEELLERVRHQPSRAFWCYKCTGPTDFNIGTGRATCLKSDCRFSWIAQPPRGGNVSCSSVSG